MMRVLVVAGLTGLWLLAGYPVIAETEDGDADSTAQSIDVKHHPVENVGQDQNMWCWAAATEMIGQYLNRPIEQCTHVQRWYWPFADCCRPETWISARDRASCVRGGWPSLPGYTSTRRACHSLWKGRDWWFERRENCYLAWDGLKEALQRAPVAFSWRFKDFGGQSGHMMVATGYVELAGGGKWVLVNDPWPPGSGDVKLIPYDRYVKGDYQHWRDYFVEAPRKWHW